MITKVTHFTYLATDQNEALDFMKKLGFTIHTDTQFGEMRWLTLTLPKQPDFEVAIMQANTPEEKALVGKQSGNYPLLAMATDDCRAEYESLKNKGVEFVDEPKEEPWGIGCSFKDLYGNTWYLCQTF